jgi:hypothetical protein
MINPLIWELDFYSRPILDENDKRIWELLICTTDRSFTYVKQCPSHQVNSSWLGAELGELVNKTGKPPLKIRFFRNSMANIITRGCKQAGLVPQASRRLFAMAAWLRERMIEVYPHHPKFQAPDPDPLPLGSSLPPRPLPPALTADGWQIVSLPSQELEDAPGWSVDFGELFPVNLAPDTPIPGIMMLSTRAVPLAAWMSGVEPVFLHFHPRADRWQLRLDSGADASWIVADLRDGAVPAAFTEAKQRAGGVHFLSLVTDPAAEQLAGFWLLHDL